MENENKQETPLVESSAVSDSVDEVLGNKKKSKTKPIFITLIALLIIVIIGVGLILWNMLGTKEASVAMVNNENITQTDFDTFFAQQEPIFTSQGVDITDPAQLQTAKSQVLETLVNQKLLLQVAKDNNISLTAEEIQGEYDKTIAQFESGEAFQTALGENNLTEESFKDRIRIELTIQKYLATQIDENVTASDEEVQALYDQYVAQGSNIPAMEEVATQLADQVKQQKMDSQVGDIISVLREGAEIETYLE